MRGFEEVEVGEQRLRVEEFSGSKSAAALRLLQYITRGTPAIVTKWGEFVREYEATHVMELDRAQAHQRFGDRPLVTDDGEPVYRTEAAPDGSLRATSELVMVPSFLDKMSESDWEKSGGKLRIPRSPSLGEVMAYLFPDALDLAEEHVVRLLALLVTSNQEVKHLRKTGGLNDHLLDRGQELMDDGLFDELLELAVVGGELVSHQYDRKAKELGSRMGEAMRLVGLKNPLAREQEDQTLSSGTSTSTSSGSSSTSSTDSPTSTDGRRTEPSTTPAGESSTVSSTV